MANKSYEGQKYRGGRKKGTKNLKRLENGNLQNMHGVEFTESEKKALESLVNSANAKRIAMLKQEATLPRRIMGIDTGQTVGQLHLMGKESDFIITRKSKSLQKFHSRDEFEKYVNYLKNVNRKDYLTDRIKQYKRNHMVALKNAFGDDAKDIIMKIRMMKPKDYMKMVQSNEELEVSYLYDPAAISGRLNQIRAVLGMRLKEDEIEVL